MSPISQSASNLRVFAFLRFGVILAAAFLLGVLWTSLSFRQLLVPGILLYAVSNTVVLYLTHRGQTNLAYIIGAVGDAIFTLDVLVEIAAAPSLVHLAHVFYIVIPSAIALWSFYLGPLPGAVAAVMLILLHLGFDVTRPEPEVNALHILVETVAFVITAVIAVTLSLLFHRELRGNRELLQLMQRRNTEITALNQLLRQHLLNFNSLVDAANTAAAKIEAYFQDRQEPPGIGADLRQALGALEDLSKRSPL